MQSSAMTPTNFTRIYKHMTDSNQDLITELAVAKEIIASQEIKLAQLRTRLDAYREAVSLGREHLHKAQASIENIHFYGLN